MTKTRSMHVQHAAVVATCEFCPLAVNFMRTRVFLEVTGAVKGDALTWVDGIT